VEKAHIIELQYLFAFFLLIRPNVYHPFSSFHCAVKRMPPKTSSISAYPQQQPNTQRPQKHKPKRQKNRYKGTSFTCLPSTVLSTYLFPNFCFFTVAYPVLMMTAAQGNRTLGDAAVSAYFLSTPPVNPQVLMRSSFASYCLANSRALVAL
jgi:hypothetical protein